MKPTPKLRRNPLALATRPAQSKPAPAPATADDGLDRYLRAPSIDLSAIRNWRWQARPAGK